MRRWIKTNILQFQTNLPSQPTQNQCQQFINKHAGYLASKILQQEYKCENENVCRQLIINLISLYTETIQFYQRIGSLKYKIYQKRMQMFLKKPIIDDILKGNSGILAIKKVQNDYFYNQAKARSKGDVQKILKQVQKKQITRKKILDEQLKQQQLNLNMRINKRKTMSNKSTKMAQQDTHQQFQASPQYKSAERRKKFNYSFIQNNNKKISQFLM